MTSGINTVSVCPYHDGHDKKAKIERLVQEMLEAKVIRLVVTREEKRWDMIFCVDYKASNEATVKGKHPIPIIDELLDELMDVTYFSKLDL